MSTSGAAGGRVTGGSPAAPNVNGVPPLILINPTDANPATTGIILKRPSHDPAGWGNAGEPYGSGQMIALLNDSAVDASDQFNPANPLLFRVDAWGNIGNVAGLHLAAGLRQQADYPVPTQVLWVNPHIDTIGQVISRPLAADVPAPTQDYFRCQDPNIPYNPVRVLTDGTMQLNKGLTVTSQLVGDVTAKLTGVANQTADVLQVFDRAGTKRVSVGTGAATLGLLSLFADDGATATVTLAALSAGNANFRAIMSAINVGVHVLGLASPAAYTGDHLQVLPSAGLKFRINKAGYPMGRLTAAPALADMVDGEWALWLDTATPAMKVTARIAGALKAGTIALV